MSLVKRYLALLAISLPVVVVDQWTKFLLRSHLAPGQSWPEQGWMLGLFRLVRAENTGAAFSMGRGLGPLFLLFAAVVSIAILVYFPRLPQGQPLLFAGVGLILGGAIGNLIDRVTVGQVTDFLAIRFFAIVNVADISLTFGVVAIVLWAILQERKKGPDPHSM